MYWCSAFVSFSNQLLLPFSQTPNMAMSSPKEQSTSSPLSVKKPSPARASAIPVSFAARPATYKKVGNTTVSSPLAQAPAPSRIPPPSPSRTLNNNTPKKPIISINRKPVPTAVFTPAPKPLTLASKATTRPSANMALQSKAGPHMNGSTFIPQSKYSTLIPSWLKF